MNAKNQVKVLNAGFTIIRKEVTHLTEKRIKAKTKLQMEWHTLEKDFKSAAAMDRRVNELLENKKFIED